MTGDIVSKVEIDSDGRRILREYRDLPYTIIAHPSFVDSYSIFLTGKGLKKIVAAMREGEDLMIVIERDKRGHFEIIDTHNKYPRRKTTQSKESSL
jgi:hypothetical protein